MGYSFDIYDIKDLVGNKTDYDFWWVKNSIQFHVYGKYDMSMQ